jgi:transcriptional regulator with XRE-family HTH domain
MSQDIRVKFSKRLQDLRKKAGFSIPDLAKKAGVSRQHIRDLELPFPQKRVTITTLEKLADALKIPVWKLLQFKD